MKIDITIAKNGAIFCKILASPSFRYPIAQKLQTSPVVPKRQRKNRGKRLSFSTKKDAPSLRMMKKAINAATAFRNIAFSITGTFPESFTKKPIPAKPAAERMMARMPFKRFSLPFPFSCNGVPFSPISPKYPFLVTLLSVAFSFRVASPIFRLLLLSAASSIFRL